MIPVYGMEDIHEGYAVMEANLNTMISNAVTIYLAGNQRPARIIDLPLESAEEMLRAGLMPATYWMEAIDPEKAEVWDVRKLLGEMNKEVRSLIQWLQRERTDVLNLGTCHKEGLLKPKESDWHTDYVIAPGLGYPRPYYRFALDNPLYDKKVKWGDHRLPHPSSDWNIGLGMTTLMLDRDRLTPKLVPDLAIYNGVDTKSIPYGALQKIAGQGKHLFALMMLYLCQGPALVARANYRRLKAEWDLTSAKDPQAKDELELFMMGVERAREIPIHPLLSVIANILNTGNLRSFWGERETLWRVGPRADPNGVPKSKGICKQKVSDMRAVLLAVAQEDYIATKKDAPCIRTSWNYKYAKGVQRACVSYAEFYRVLASSEHITSLWPEIVRVLGWSEISADAGLQDAFGADFAITDGDRATNDLIASALGLRPLVNVGNYKIAGVSLRTDEAWNLPPMRAAVNVIPIPGEASVVPESTHVEQLAFPVGMWMGEENTHAHTAEGYLNSNLGKAVVEYWGGKQSTYWDRYYRDPSKNGVTIEMPLRETSWDPEGYKKDGNPTELAGKWIEAGKGQSTAALLTPYMIREGQKLRLRVPTLMARGDDWEYYNIFGAYTKDMPFEGHVQFNGEINFKSGTDGALLALIESGPSAAVSGVAELTEALET
jgi:hypothetical protein